MLKSIYKFDNYHFETEVPVRITDINYGDHLGNDSFVSVLHEARVRFLDSIGYSELKFGTVSLIMVDLYIKYKQEVFYPDILQVKIGIQNLKKCSFDIVYAVTSKKTGKEAAAAKTSMASFNYDTRRIVKLPRDFAERYKDCAAE
jgi:acyl-CoA thioesterase FadM